MRVAVLVTALVVLSGCGSSERAPGPQPRDSAPVERTAIFVIATASGRLRELATATKHPSIAAVRALRARLTRVRARDPDLAAARDRLTAGADALLAGHRRDATAATSAANAGLERYAAAHPTVRDLVPE